MGKWTEWYIENFPRVYGAFYAGTILDFADKVRKCREEFEKEKQDKDMELTWQLMGRGYRRQNNSVIGKAFIKLGGKLIETDVSFMRINEGSKPVNLMDKEPSEKPSISSEDFLKIFFEDNKQQMEKKQPDPVIIVPPQGWEVDTEKSTSGRIEFREVKKITYTDVARLYQRVATIPTSSNAHSDRIIAINKILGTAKYLNEKGKDTGYYFEICDGKISIGLTKSRSAEPMFTSKEVAQQALEILGEDVIRMALCQDY